MKLNLIESESRIKVTPDKGSGGILSYNSDNKYPQTIERLAAASGRAMMCLDTFGKFVKGKGFNDINFSSVIVGRNGLTADKLLRKSTKDYRFYKSFYWHINFNMMGEPVEITPVPFKEVRLGMDDEGDWNGTYKHYTDWAKETRSNINHSKVTVYNRFNPEKVLQEIIDCGGIENYKGQLFCYTEEEGKYPTSTIDSIIESVAADAAIKDFTLNNTTTSFMAFYFLLTGACKTDDERNSYSKMIKNFTGGKRAAKVMHVEKENETDVFDLKKVDLQQVDDLFKNTEISIRENIRQPFGTSPVLLGDQVPGKLGSTQQELKDATEFYNWMTYDDRLAIEEAFTRVFTNWHDKTQLPKNLNFAIEQVSAVVVENSQPLAVQIGVGGTTALQMLLSDTALSPAQKINSLIILFGVSQDRAESMVNGTPIK